MCQMSDFMCQTPTSTATDPPPANSPTPPLPLPDMFVLGNHLIYPKLKPNTKHKKHQNLNLYFYYFVLYCGFKNTQLKVNLNCPIQSFLYCNKVLLTPGFHFITMSHHIKFSLFQSKLNTFFAFFHEP